MKEKTVSKKKILFSYIIKGFIPLFIFIVASTVFIYRADLKSKKTIFEKNQNGIVDNVTHRVQIELSSIISDLMTLSDSKNLYHFLKTNEKNFLESLSHDFLAFVSRKKIYDQARFLDNLGMEVIRANHNYGDPILVKGDNLQNKSRRYYFKDAFKLKKNEVFVSPFDLNIEQGQIEKPLKPMIRFGTPVLDEFGKKQGIVLLNYLGNNLLRHLDRPKDELGSLLLLNNNSFYLKGDQEGVEWGFMFENRQDSTFARRFPKEWREISKNKFGQIVTSNGMFTYSTVFPFSESLKSSSGSGKPFEPSEGYITGEKYFWKIISFASIAQLNSSYKSKMRYFILLDAVFLYSFTG